MTRRDILEPLHVLILECGLRFPELSSCMLEDLQELTERVNARGLGVLLMTLPEIGKSYDKALSSGYFSAEWPPELKRTGSPAIFERLITASLRLGEMDDELHPELVFFTRCILYLYKKYEIDCPTEHTIASVREFIEVDRSLREPTHKWENPTGFTHASVRRLTFYQEDLLDGQPTILKKGIRLLDIVASIATPKNEYIPWDIHPRHGPGAVSDLSKWGDKYVNLLTWPGKLAEIHDETYYRSHAADLSGPFGWNSSVLQLEPDWIEVIEEADSFSGYEVDSRLCAVPKTYKGPRLITIEGTANQYIQQGMLGWLRRNFSPACRNSISFKDQSLSGSFALLASVDGRYATVDLSAASDRLSLWTVERAIKNPSLLGGLASCRASRVSIPGPLLGEPLGEDLWLKKYAGMGNATTFPVQSYVYWLCCVSAFLATEGLKATPVTIREASREIRVFGDDLIVPATSVPVLGLILGYLQLKVNVHKTHYQGRFRESCGVDAICGVDVTPFYLKSCRPTKKAASLVAWVDARNNAYSKGLWILAKWFEDQLPVSTGKLIHRGPRSTGALTYLTFLPNFYQGKKARWNEELQRPESRGLVPKVKVRRVVRETELDLLQYFLESPGRASLTPGLDPISMWEPGYQVGTSSVLSKTWVPTL